MSMCGDDECEKPHYAKGLCHNHYQWFRKNWPVPLKPPDGERFWSKINVTPDCWEWTEVPTSKGYGRFWVRPRGVLAHVWAYESARGPVPEGLVLDHLCRNTLCVRPDHLEAVTQRENILRGEAPAAHEARKTHCHKGHPFNEENTHVFPSKPHSRVCRLCLRERREQYNTQRRADRRAKAQAQVGEPATQLLAVR